MILVCSTFISLCVQTFFRLLLDLNYFNYSKYFQGFRFVYCSIFKILTLHRPYAVQLYYHITLFAFCQAFFVIFFAARFLSDSLFIIPPFHLIVKGFSAILSHFVNFYIYIKNPLTFLFIQSNRPANAKKEPHIVQFFEGADRI